MRSRLRVIVAALLVGTLAISCKTVTVTPTPLLLPEKPSRPQLENELSIEALLRNESALMLYARRLEVWVAAVEELNGNTHS